MRLPRISVRKVERTLHRSGFVAVRQKGSHVRWVHPDGRKTVVPRHSGRTVKLGTLHSIMEDTGLKAEDFR